MKAWKPFSFAATLPDEPPLPPSSKLPAPTEVHHVPVSPRDRRRASTGSVRSRSSKDSQVSSGFSAGVSTVSPYMLLDSDPTQTHALTQPGSGSVVAGAIRDAAARRRGSTPSLPPEMDASVPWSKRVRLDRRQLSLFVNLEAAHIRSKADVQSVRCAVLDVIPDGMRVHAAFNYDHSSIADDMIPAFTNMLRSLSADIFLSVKQYTTDCFYPRALFAAKGFQRTPVDLLPGSSRRNSTDSLGAAAPAAVGSYLVEAKPLASGAFGMVHTALNTATGTRVAVKVLGKEAVRAIRAKAFVERERRALRMLSHPDIPQLLDDMEDKRACYLVLDFIDGLALSDALAAVPNRCLAEAAARSVFRSLVAVMQHLHGRGVVHRDIKPENLILRDVRLPLPDLGTRRGGVRVAVIDFGTADFFDPDEKTPRLRAFVGSPLYCAPEMYREDAYHGPEVDVWSMGCTLFQIITGTLPFAYSQDILAGQSTPLPVSASAALRHLLRGMLSVDPATRLSLAEIAAHPWLHGQGLTRRRSQVSRSASGSVRDRGSK